MINDYYEKYANLLVRCGLNLQPKQNLYVNLPLEAADFSPYLARAAYQAGAANYFPDYADYSLDLIRIIHQNSFDDFINYSSLQKIALLDHNSAYLTLSPGLLQIPAELEQKMSQLEAAKNRGENLYRKARQVRVKPNTCKALIPTKYWAEQSFPAKSSADSLAQLWHYLAEISLVNTPDPIAAWQTRIRQLQERVNYLNHKQFAKLHFYDTYSDLSVELIPDHNWVGGCEYFRDDLPYMPNFPTEEIFNAPYKYGLNGHICSSKPLFWQNHKIENIRLEFAKGKIIQASAEIGDEYLQAIINTDLGSNYTGEIAILPGKNLVHQTGQVFNVTLIDENAACHLAIGRAYLCNIKNPKPDLARDFYGVNDSQIHVDLMFGTEFINVDAYTQDGSLVPLLIEGSWAI